MENDATKKHAGQEIDLLEILRKCGQWCANVLRAVFVFLLRKSVWLACFALTGIAIGLSLYASHKPYYSAHMLVQANVVDNFFYVNLINEELAVENISNPLDWVRKLAIPATVAKKIYSVRACYGIDLNKDGLPDIIDEENKYILSRDSAKVAKILRGSFYISVWAYSHEVLPHIRQNLMNFINRNEYVQRHNVRRVEEVNEQIAYLQQQINRFDSLQKYEYFQKDKDKKAIGSGQLLVLNESTQPLYHSELISLHNQLLEKNTTLQLYSEPVTITQEFAETFQRKNNFMFYVKPLVICSLLVGFILLLVWDYRKPLLKLYRNR
ncbi:MAG: hypothetical protein LBI89_02715 [Prevotellaceae bacterium]|jgi:uncharacterized small protein (DUF1192 family)|nr:hypothetical protein [Prevotellaceae bacterium]